MALITSHTGLETLNVEVGDMQYHHYSGGFYLYINFIVQNPARPEQICEIGDVLTGPKFAKSLQQFDFTKNSFHYTFDFNWENDSDNAGWWIRKTARRATVDVEFVFLRTFHWITENEDQDGGGGKDGKENDPMQWVVEEVTGYIKPIRAAQEHLPSLKLRISAGDPVMRNGVIGCVGSPKAKLRRVLASAPDNHVIVESRARITAERAEFDRFIEALQYDIHGAEQEFFKTHPECAPKNQSLPVPQAATTLCYVDHGDGTVTDRQTGLQWMRFSLGQEWQERVCLGEIRKYTQQEALNAAIELNGQGGYAGHADWRLPTIEELQTLIYCSRGQLRLWNDAEIPCQGKYERPTIYQPAFPNTLTCEYWSSTAYDRGFMWGVCFNNGLVYWYLDENHYPVRLVRMSDDKKNQSLTIASQSQVSMPPVLAPLSVFRDPLRNGRAGPAMIAIPASEFWMGSPESEVGRFSNERRHWVKIEWPFSIGKYAVTFEEYDRFCMAEHRAKPQDEGWGRGTQPVINVSWVDALNYTEWLSAQTGQNYRLPTEAEWEYAARAGTETAFWWGNEISPAQANYDMNLTKTVPVNHFQPNPWGLYQVHGNVYEWTGSRYDENYGGAELLCVNKDVSGPVAARGGGWTAPTPARVRSAFRSWSSPTVRLYDQGFRLARSL